MQCQEKEELSVSQTYVEQVKRTIRGYLITTVLSIALAIVSIGYNVWRMAETEQNANVRDAAFRVLLALAEFQEVIYAAHYDKLEIEGSPRRGWVKVKLVEDMCILVGGDVVSAATELREIWQRQWPTIRENREAADLLVTKIEDLREILRRRLMTLT